MDCQIMLKAHSMQLQFPFDWANRSIGPKINDNDKTTQFVVSADLQLPNTATYLAILQVIQQILMKSVITRNMLIKL